MVQDPCRWKGLQGKLLFTRILRPGPSRLRIRKAANREVCPVTNRPRPERKDDHPARRHSLRFPSLAALALILWGICWHGVALGEVAPLAGTTWTGFIPFAREGFAGDGFPTPSSALSIAGAPPETIPLGRAPAKFPVSGKGMATSARDAGTATRTATASPVSAPVAASSFPGMAFTGWIPPDTMGAAGPGHLLSTLNGGVGVFDKATGALLLQTTLQGFWSPLGTAPGAPGNDVFDPKVLYDQHSGRFIAVSIGGRTSPDSWILVAVSASSDPSGIWNLYAIDADLDGGVQLNQNWADFPCLGVDANRVYVTANMFSNADAFQYSKVWVLQKAPLLSGSPVITVTEFRNPAGADSVNNRGAGFTMQPVHVFGNAPAEYLVFEWNKFITGTPPRLFLQIASIADNGSNLVWNDLGRIEVASYPEASLPDAPQLGSTDNVDSGDARMANAVYRNGSIWTAHTVADTTGSRTEVAWYQLTPSSARPTAPFGVPAQQGRISDPSRFYYYPSIAVNGRGDVAIGFSGSSPSEFVGGYFASRAAVDPAGSTATPVLLKAGEGGYSNFGTGTKNRWGDYSATCVDPSDDRVFWTLQEYARPPSGPFGRWGTWWGSFTVEPAPTGLGPAGIFGTADGGSGGGCSVANGPPRSGRAAEGAATVAALLFPAVALALRRKLVRRGLFRQSVPGNRPPVS